MAETEHITFESGDKSEFDSEDNAADTAVNETAAMVGTYGYQITIDGAGTRTAGYITTSISTNVIRFRFYYDVNSLTVGASDNFYGPHLYTDGSHDSIQFMGFFQWQYKSGSHQVRVFAIEDDGGNQDTGWDLITDEPHYFEVMIERESTSSAADGTLTLWIDGVQTGDAPANVENYALFPTFDEFALGFDSLDAGTTGSVYFDDLVINDDGCIIGKANV